MWCVPLCGGCHLDDADSLHRAGEKEFWARVGLDPLAMAERLYDLFLTES